MRTSLRSLTISRMALAASALWIYGAGAAWAGGGGGESLTSLNNLITGLCGFLNMTSCPQFPTITQAVLEVAGLETSPPEMVRALNSVPAGSTVDAGNAAAIPPITFPLIATTSPTFIEPVVNSDAARVHLVSEQELRDRSGAERNKGAAAAAPLYDTDADTFLYAVASGSSVATSGWTIPDTFYLLPDKYASQTRTSRRGELQAELLAAPLQRC